MGHWQYSCLLRVHQKNLPRRHRCESAEEASSAFARAARAAFLPIDSGALAPQPAKSGASAPAGLGKCISADDPERAEPVRSPRLCMVYLQPPAGLLGVLF